MLATETICNGVLNREDGLCAAKGVRLTFALREEFGMGDIRGTLAVYDDPMFARRYTGKRFVFVPSRDPEHPLEVFVIGTDGTCLVFPISKREG